ncbi:LysR family transcriptional regulator [Paraburkholderia sp. J11-2]|uniref:LysR family transcriptional regulator n=1 Tax=Paraburkholderia sp. J11-2 TaxID=2805431 RepID=UPI002AB6A3DB|nr:LysR family transcriptional regulator [Paraburkholderia sp. J11-2]
MLDLNLLRALDALLDERNVTRAAQRLSLTQPAVSAMLTRLRESFGDPLFVRSQRGIVPTERALQLAAPLKQVLSEIEQMLQPQAFAPAEAEMTLTLASTDYALRAVVVPFLARLRESAPGVRAVIVPVQHERLQAQLESGDVDMALITPESTPADLHARRLFDERYVCVMRVDHPAAARRLTLERFCALDHALVSYAGASLSGVTDEALARVGRARRVTVSVNSFLVLPDILLTSDLIAVVPSRLVKDARGSAQGLAVIDPPLEIPGFTKTLAWHERTHRSPGHQWVRALLFETCEALAGATPR